MFPTIFQSDYFTVHSLWLFIAIATIVGTMAFIKISVKNGLKLQFLTEHILIILLVAVVGARLVAIIENWTSFFYEYSWDTFLQIFKVWDKGVSVWGGIAAGILIFYYFCKKNDQNFLKWLDSIIPTFFIWISISAVGMFLDGINYGNETSLPWGVNFESPAIKYTVPIHPTQIYILLYSSAIAITLILSRHHKFFKENGKTAIVGIAAFSLMHFLQEFLRGDDVAEILGIRLPQIISLLIFIISLIFYFFQYNETGKALKGSKLKKTTF